VVESVFHTGRCRDLHCRGQLSRSWWQKRWRVRKSSLSDYLRIPVEFLLPIRIVWGVPVRGSAAGALVSVSATLAYPQSRACLEMV